VLRDIVLDAGVPAQRVHVVPNGVALERFADLPRRGDDHYVVLGFVGFMRPWHGLDAVIDGLADEEAGEGLALILVGDGPSRAALEQKAAASGVADRVVFAGVVAQQDVPAWVGRFDIALQPQATAYASPLKIFDYMAAGCAIVAPDQPNIREILRHGQTALLFDPLDPDGMWSAVRSLAADPDLRARLGQAARAELEARDYTWQHNAARITDWARTGAGEAPPA
jgi:glycosyltransferase involved in cell wall biosynthesis